MPTQFNGARTVFLTKPVGKTRFSYAFPKEFPYKMNHILECEFCLLELMDCCLIVYHLYRPLLPYMQDMGQEDQKDARQWFAKLSVDMEKILEIIRVILKLSSGKILMREKRWQLFSVRY